MFRDMRNATKSGTIVSAALAGLRRRLPPGWSIDERGGVARLSGPGARTARLKIVARSALLPRDVYAIVAEASGPVLIVAPFIGERARQVIAESGGSYADASGNMRVVASEPAIFVEGVGADRDPQRAERPLQSLRGAAAGRVVRALAELDLPLGVRALAAASQTPLGTVSRVVTFLDAEAVITRDAQKQITSVDRPALLQRWSRDYSLTGSNVLHTCLEPRGLVAFWSKLRHLPRYAVTGSPAGPGIAPTRIAMVYVDDPTAAAQTLGLAPADAGANVWLLQPYDDVVYQRTRQRPIGAPDAGVHVTTVSVPQAFVDLASAPGRGPQEAESLLAQMMELQDVG